MLLLDDDGPLEVVTGPAAFPPQRDYDGLDASGEWAPLLRPDVLFDYDSFTVWEQHLVRTLSSSTASVADTLGRVATTAEQLRTWTVERGPLQDWTAAVCSGHAATDAPALDRYDPYTGIEGFLKATRAVPAGLDAPSLPPAVADDAARLVTPKWDLFAPGVLRYLAAKAFASWTAYQARGVRTQIAELHVAAGVLWVECVRACQKARAELDRDILLEAVRASDLLLVHLVDRAALMACLGKAEANAVHSIRR
jgi:hypothetical protein